METHWKKDDLKSLSEVVCQVVTETILLADLKTIQPSMTQKEISAMKGFNPNFTEVGWLNDKVKYSINHRFFHEIIACDGHEEQETQTTTVFAERGTKPFLESPCLHVKLPGWVVRSPLSFCHGYRFGGNQF